MSSSAVLGLVIGLPVAVAAGVLLWAKRNRAYHSSESVAAAYDAWTEDRLLENLWGEHVHLGHELDLVISELNELIHHAVPLLLSLLAALAGALSVLQLPNRKTIG